MNYAQFNDAFLAGAIDAIVLILITPVFMCMWSACRRRIRSLELQVSEQEQVRSEVAEARQQVAALVQRLEELEGRPTTPDIKLNTSSLNLNSRGQVLRLHRKGDSPSQIASALGLSQGEVRLTLKMHDMVLEKPSRETSDRSL